LVKADSTARKGELAAAQVIAGHLARSGIESRIDRWDRTRANISATIASQRTRPALLFACHLDVVEPGQAPWDRPPFSGDLHQGRVYGRGATDMKGGIAATVTAIRQVVDARTRLLGDLVFAAVAGEETDSCGARRLIQSSPLPELAGVVIPEPTDFQVVTAHRGILWLEIATRGKTAHSSTPELGVNAISAMKRVLDRLEHYRIPVEPHELLGRCSMSINTISGGRALNVVPDKCTIGIDIRTLPGQDTASILAELRQIFEEIKADDPDFGATVSVTRQVPAMQTDTSTVFVRDLCSVVGAAGTTAAGFTTDGPHFASLGAPVVVFGPGKPELCHKPNEYVDLCDLEKAVGHYRNIILKFLT